MGVAAPVVRPENGMNPPDSVHQGVGGAASASEPAALAPREQDVASLRHKQQRLAAPPVFRGLGGIYVVLSGTVFLQRGISNSLTVALWTVTAGLGLATIGAGWWMRRHELAPARLNALCAAIGLVFVGHALLFVGVVADPGQSTYLLTLLAAGGFFLLSRAAVAAFMAGSLLGWFLVSWSLGLPLTAPENGYVLAGSFVGLVAHAIRNRNLRAVALGHSAMLGNLQASEERFRSLAEAAQDAILLVDAAGRLTYLNPAGLALFGLRPEEAAVTLLSQIVANGGTGAEHFVGTHEVKGRRRDGSTFPAELSLARTQREGVVIYTGILRDTTARHRAVAASQAAAEHEAAMGKLRAMNEFKTSFLNMAAHELNTPLTPLRLQLHLLRTGQMGEMNERQRKAVAVLDRNVLRLSGLVGEILEVARLQSGRLKLSVAAVAVDDVVDEVLASFVDTARGVGVELSFAGAQNLVVVADRNRVTQILFNLVSNAIKFTPAGGRVIVEAAARGEVVEIQVKDNGLGLAPEQIERLFQPFVQVHDPMLITAAGTGLGLFISKGLVEAQGGTIAVASEGPGRGSTFRFTLPVTTSAPAARQPIHINEDPMVRRLRELI